MNATFVLDNYIPTVVALVVGENRGGGGGVEQNAQGKKGRDEYIFLKKLYG